VLDRALGGYGAAPVASFLNEAGASEVRSAVRRCLPSEHGDVALRLVRTKLSPGRKLTAEYDVLLPSSGQPRRICVAWVAPGVSAPGPAAGGEAEARARGVLAPFTRSWVGSGDGRGSLSVAPVDGAFPQLVRLHDRRHVIQALPRSADGAAPEELDIATVRFRPGQRHVLRISLGAPGPAWFAKVYRDDAGARTVAAAGRAAAVFAARGGALPVSPGAGVHVAPDRTVFWREVRGPSLAEVVRSGAAAGEVVRTAGAALRLLHDSPSTTGLPTCPGAAEQAEETLRTARLVDALAPAVGAQLRRTVDRVLEGLGMLPGEPPTVTHGDFKCDNLLVSGSRLHLLDFDRFGTGDPAADLGKFLADLRWWTGLDERAPEDLHENFLDGYGATAPERIARARMYDVLLQLRMAARRVPVQDPAWEVRVSRAVRAAAGTLAEGVAC
jgi:aminoglycoside phosphotransferase (APT) family kinase protein